MEPSLQALHEMWLVSHSHMMGGQNHKVRKNEQQKTWNLSRNIAAKWGEYWLLTSQLLTGLIGGW